MILAKFSSLKWKNSPKFQLSGPTAPNQPTERKKLNLRKNSEFFDIWKRREKEEIKTGPVLTTKFWRSKNWCEIFVLAKFASHKFSFITQPPLLGLRLLLGSLMVMDPHPSQQHVGPQFEVWQLWLQVARPKTRFKPFSPEKSGVKAYQLCFFHFSLFT